MTEQEYRDLPVEKYFSYSFLKKFDENGPTHLVSPKETFNTGIWYGRIVDDLTFSYDKFEDKYYVSKIEKDLTTTEKQLSEALVEWYDKSKLTKSFLKSEEFKKECLNFIKDLKLWKNIKDESILLNKIDNNFINHMLEINLSDSKQIISSQDYMDAVYAKRVLTSHEFTSEYFKSEDIKKKQVLFQIPILFKIQDDNFKSLLDIILIDHEKKQIRAIDLKTGSKPNKYFKYEFLKYRYDIQAFLYTKALEEYIIQNGLKDYSIQNPLYIHICRNTLDVPLVFEIEPNVLYASYNGFRSNSGYNYKGVKDLVTEINWHRENNLFEYTMKQYQNKKDTISMSDYGNPNIRYHGENQIFDNYDRNISTPGIESWADEIDVDLDQSSTTSRDRLDELRSHLIGIQRNSNIFTGTRRG